MSTKASSFSSLSSDFHGNQNVVGRLLFHLSNSFTIEIYSGKFSSKKQNIYMLLWPLLFVETICIAVIMQMLTACNSYSFVGLLWAIVKLNELIGACASHKIFHSCMQHCSTKSFWTMKMNFKNFHQGEAYCANLFCPSNKSLFSTYIHVAFLHLQWWYK